MKTFQQWLAEIADNYGMTPDKEVPEKILQVVKGAMPQVMTDGRGWPHISFAPDNQDQKSVLTEREEEWMWNGDRFLVLARKDMAEVKDKYGEDGLDAKPFLIETPILAALAHGWTRFVVGIPRQQEFASKTA